MAQRRWLLPTIVAVVAVVLAVIYYHFDPSQGGGWFPQCGMYRLTGLRCPSCGITHMFIDLLHGDLKSAFKDNQFLFLTWPFAACEIIYLIYLMESRKDIPRANVMIITVYSAALLTFGILRILLHW